MKFLPPLIRVTIFGCLLFFTCCEKGETTDPIPETPLPADSNAIFQLLLSQPNCTTIRISAVFYESKPLESGEGIDMKVSVTKPGRWEINTDTVNGVYFSGRGNFSDTGVKVVSLAGSGTPVTTGYTITTIKQAGTSYPVEYSVVKGGIQQELVPAHVYFKGKINGISYTLDASRDDTNNIVYGYGGYGGNDTDSLSFSTHVASATGGGTISVSNQYLPNFKLSSEMDFKSFFKAGSYPYLSLACPFPKPVGIYIGWAEPSGVPWISIQDGKNQKGSYYNIVGVEDGHNQAGLYYVKVKSRFECMLYRINATDSVKLTEGEMVSYFIRPKL